jgi:hypothetical protein
MSDPAPTKLRPIHVAAGVLALAWLVVHLLTLTRYPILTCDEAFYSQVGTLLVGLPRGHAAPLISPGFIASLLPYGRINLAGIGLVQLALGIDPFSVRLWGLIGWIAAIAGTYWTGRRLNLGGFAAGAAALMAVAWLPMFYGHNARPHIWTAAIGVGSLGLLKAALDDPRPGRLVAVTLFPALMLDLHLNSAHFLIASALIASWLLIRRRQVRHIGWLALGGLLALPLLIGARFVPSPQAMLDVLRSRHPLAVVEVYSLEASPGVGEMGADAFLLALPQRLIAFFPWWVRNYVYPPTYEGLGQAVLFLAGLGIAPFSQNAHHRLLAAYYGVSAASFAALVTFKWETYSVVWVPLLVLLAAAGMQWLDVQLPRLRAGYAALGLALLMYLAGDGVLLRQPRSESLLAARDRVADVIRPGDVVMADLTWWLVLPQARLVDEHYEIDGLLPVPRHELYPGGPGALARSVVLSEPGVDYLLSDDLLGCVDSPTEGSRALAAVARELCTPVDSFVIIRPDGTPRDTILYACGATR